MKKISVIIVSYILFAFALILSLELAFAEVPVLLEGAKTSYLFYKSILVFFRLLPALFASGFLIACAVGFRKDAQKAKLPYSPVIVSFFKKVFIAGLLMSLVVFAGNEIVIPGMLNSIRKAEEAPSLLEEFLELGNKSLENKNYALAYEYGIQAKGISPESKKAQALIDKAESLRDVKDGERKDKRLANVNEIYFSNESEGKSVMELLLKSQKAAAEEKWFECHYWAELALAISDEKDINVREVKRMSALAWGKLSDPAGLRRNESNEIFLAKRDAYSSLQAENNLDAYYKFTELNRKLSGAIDPDVIKFLEIAKNRVMEQCFFIDETENLEKFESTKDVFFSIPHTDGTKDAIFIRGVTPVETTGGYIQYLRGFSLVKFGKDGKLLYKMSVPYAKLMAEKAEIFTAEDKTFYDLKDEYETVPYLMLKSVDRYTRDIVSEPVFEGKDDLDERDKTFAVFSIPYEYFSIICEAQKGEKLMNFSSLYYFTKKAEEFGYSTEVFGSSLLYRSCIPFIMFLIFLFVALMAWNYRMESDQLFKFVWILVLPVISFIFFLIIEAVLAVFKLFNFALFGFVGSYSIIVAILAFGFLIFVLSLSFLKRTSE